MRQARAGSPFPGLALPAWVSSCDDEELRRAAGSGGVARGTQYARSGAVLSLSRRADGALVGEVRGSGRRRYVAVVRPGEARAADWSGSCECPVQVDCKHAVAVVLTARRLVPPAAAPPAPPAWERRLSAFAEVDAAGSGAARGLQLELVQPAGPGSLQRRLRLRPVRPGASGRWVRTGVTWRDLQHASAPTCDAPRGGPRAAASARCSVRAVPMPPRT